mgnify:CR=1 FL=1
MKNIFLSGCPRSGTTALWKLFASEPKIAMGLERFKNRCRNEKFSLEESLYAKKRFFDMQDGDTHFKDLVSGEGGKYYAELKGRFDKCELVGDKLPNLYRFLPEVSKSFSNAKTIVIVRNVFDVAQSYEARLRNEKDKWDRDFKDGVNEWNVSVRKTLANLGPNVHVLIYEDFFFTKGTEHIHKLEEFLDFKFSAEFFNTHKALVNQSLEKDKSRQGILSSRNKLFISKNANFGIYKKLINAISHDQKDPVLAK